MLAQTRACDEILIVDDGSTDGTAEYIRQLRHHHGMKINYLRQENCGPAAARNFGIRHARHAFIAFLDSDDHWHKRKIETQLGCMQAEPGYLISHTRERWLRRGEHLNQKKKHRPGHGDIFQHCLELCAVGMSTVMVRRELFDRVGLFDTGLRCCEDYDLWLRVSCRYRFLLVDEPLTIKEGGREDQVSWQYRIGMDKLRIRAIVKMLAAGLLTPDQLMLAGKELVKKATIYGNGCIRHGRVEEGEQYLRLAKKVGKGEALAAW